MVDREGAWFGEVDGGEGRRSERRGGGAHRLPSLLDRVHETVKVGAQRLEACWIQQETTLARGSRGSGRRAGAGLGEGNLLVLAKELDFALREAQLRVGYGGGHHTLLTPWSDQRRDAHGTGAQTDAARRVSGGCCWR